MKKFYCIALLILLVITSQAAFLTVHSETYYVNAASGNNSNTPAQAKNISTPWQTVQFAVNNPAVVNGDNIVVASGVYAGFDLTKRLNIIGAWKGTSSASNTIFNSMISLSAPGGNSSQRMVLKNLRIASTHREGIIIFQSFVTLENVFSYSTDTYGNGVKLDADLTDIDIEACNFEGSKFSGLYFTEQSGVDGFIMRNTTVRSNEYFGIVAFQRRTNPTEIKNVEISHCLFENNNASNQVQGHTIYFEKLKNSVFENITVSMPLNNNRIGIDINVLSRTDYSNVVIRNSRIFRASPGSGIWIQARNDLPDPPARLDGVTLTGLTFSNCDTNIAFNRQVKNMTVEKCDLSTYGIYGLVNFTDQGGTINANNNKWKNGQHPDTTVISGGLLQTGQNIISFMPSTDGIFLGMCIVGPGIPPGSVVVSRSANSIIMNNNATASGFIPGIGFAFNCATSTNIVRTSLNFVSTANPLPHAIINQANISFPDLASAIAGTTSGGTIWNVPNATITGTTLIDKNLKLIGPGAGFLHPQSLTAFENLTVSGADLTMGSDFAVTNNFTPNHVEIGNDNTLMILGAIVPGGLITGGGRSDIFVGGGSSATALTTVSGGLRTLQVARVSGISLADELSIHRLLFLEAGILSLQTYNLNLDTNVTLFNPLAALNYVATNNTGELRKHFTSTTVTSFNFAVGNNGYSPAFFFISGGSFLPNAYVSSRAVNAKHPENYCPTDYLNRYWEMRSSGISNFSSNSRFTYQTSDVVGIEANLFGSMWNGFVWNMFTAVNAAANNFTADNVSALGDFTAGGQNCIGGSNTVINAKVFLQGSYSGVGIMRTSLNSAGLIPLTQPYAGSQYNYNGTESVASIPADVTDWVYLEVRSTSNGGAVPNGKRAAFIKSNGEIVDLDGVTPVKIPSVAPGNYFIVVGHRNHLPVMSASAQPLNSASLQYDFSTGLNQFYGGAAASLSGNLFGMFAGDANKTFIITAADYTIVTNNITLANYNQGDVNMSGIVTAADYSFITANLTRGSNVPNYQ